MNSPRLMWDQRGIVWSLPMLIILAFLGIFGISIFSAINLKFLLALLIISVIGLTVAGALFFKVDFKYVIIIGILCLGIVVFMEITAPVILGLMLVAFAMWKLTPAKQPAIFIALVGVGCLIVLWGSSFVIETLGWLP